MEQKKTSMDTAKFKTLKFFLPWLAFLNNGDQKEIDIFCLVVFDNQPQTENWK